MPPSSGSSATRQGIDDQHTIGDAFRGRQLDGLVQLAWSRYMMVHDVPLYPNLYMYSNSQSYELFDDSARNNNNYQSFPQKISGKFAGFEKTAYLCTAFRKHAVQRIGI